jgi:hypothetical protein
VESPASQELSFTPVSTKAIFTRTGPSSTGWRGTARRSAPTLVVDGRYLTSPGTLAQHMDAPREQLFQATLEVADKLGSRAAQGK